MSQDDPPETTFVALTPPSARGRTPSPPAAASPATPTPSASPPTPATPTRRPKAPRVGAGGFSGYQVNDSTTELRRQDSSALVWGAAGVALGLLLLGAAAVLLSTLS